MGTASPWDEWVIGYRLSLVFFRILLSITCIFNNRLQLLAVNIPMRNDEVYSIGIVPNYNGLRDNDWLKIVFVHQIKVLRAEQLDDINK